MNIMFASQCKRIWTPFRLLCSKNYDIPLGVSRPKTSKMECFETIINSANANVAKYSVLDVYGSPRYATTLSPAREILKYSDARY